MDYINREGRYFLDIQAVTDHKYCFIDVRIELLGCAHEVQVFQILLSTQN